MQILIFFSILLCLATYGVASLLVSNEDLINNYGHISPVKLWAFIDEGIFGLLDDDENQHLSRANEIDSEQIESRSNIERRLAADLLSEKAFYIVKRDTIQQIEEGLVRGNLDSFESHNEEAG